MLRIVAAFSIPANFGAVTFISFTLASGSWPNAMTVIIMHRKKRIIVFIALNFNCFYFETVK
jgi:hypothetical protein